MSFIKGILGFIQNYFKSLIFLVLIYLLFAPSSDKEFKRANLMKINLSGPIMSDEEFWEHIVHTHPYMKKRYKDSKRIVDVGSLSGYSSAVKKLFGKNFILTGNASEFLDPVFSSGVTLALESGSKAAELTARELNGESIDYQVEYEDHMMVGINVFRDYVDTWYDGTLQTILFSDKKNAEITKKVVSILSGYVWDKNNSFVTSSRYALEKTYEMVK